MVGFAYIAADRWEKPTGEMVFGPGCRELLAHSRCQREPFVAFVEGIYMICYRKASGCL
jgi:hypothetical protein